MEMEKNMKKGVRSAALAVVAAAALVGCDAPRVYERALLPNHYEAIMGQEQVRLKRSDCGSDELHVIRTNGTEIVYRCFNTDLSPTLCGITIFENGRQTIFTDDASGIEVLREGQSRFDGYLAFISKQMKKEGIEALRRKD